MLKRLEENMGNNLEVIVVRNLSINSSTTGTSRRYQLMGLHENRKFKQNKWTAHRMGENLINHTLDKGLISRSYKELQKLNIKEIKLSVSKWTNKSNTQLVFFFFKQTKKKNHLQVAFKYLKCSVFLTIKVSKSEVSLRPPILIWIAMFKNSNIMGWRDGSAWKG